MRSDYEENCDKTLVNIETLKSTNDGKKPMLLCGEGGIPDTVALGLNHGHVIFLQKKFPRLLC